MDPIEDLKSALSMALLDSEYDPDGTTEEHIRIRGLASVVRQLEDGGMSYQEVSEVFRNQNIDGFDFHAWYQAWVEAGVYREPTERDG